MGYCTAWATGATKRECRVQMQVAVRAAERAFGYAPDVSQLVWVREVISRFDGVAVIVERTWKLWFHLDK